MILAGDRLKATITERRQEGLMSELVPGGYVFTHLVFWTVVAMVAVGTNAVAIILMVGLGMMTLESFRKA